MDSKTCHRCGAPLPARTGPSGVVRCEYCDTTVDVDPSVGPLLTAIDFERSDPPGWRVPTPQLVRLAPRGEWLVQTEGDPKSAWIVASSQAQFDDFDLRLTFRLLWGDVTSTRVGLAFRETKQDEYRVFVSTVGTCRLAYVPAEGKSRTLLPWTRQSSVRTQAGDINELRVVASGDRIRVLLNGAQATAVRDPGPRFGRVSVLTQSNAPMAVALRGLDVWEHHVATPHALGQPQQASFELWDVYLANVGPKKIQTIKVVRELTGLGLKEAKDLVERTPAVVRQGLAEQEAREASRKLEHAQAQAELRPARR